MRFMKVLATAFRVLIALAVIAAVGAWLQWGTLDPCEAFKRELLRQVNDSARTPVQKARLPQALKQTRELLDNYMPSLRPRKCFAMLWRTNIKGVAPFDVISLKGKGTHSPLKKDPPLIPRLGGE